jgi:Na+/proline symporter
LINAISSLIIVDANKIIKFKEDNLKISKSIIIFLSLIAIFVASKGLSILYLFLLADLFCCAAVLSTFYGFYSTKFTEKNAYISILIGLFIGLLFFPSPDFSKSILIGFLFPADYFPALMSESLLFLSFLLATFAPLLTWKIK